MIRHWYTCCLFACLFLYCRAANAQNKAIDSMEQALVSAGQDTNRVHVLNALGWQYASSNNEKAIRYCNEAVALAKKLDFRNGLATAYNTLSNAYEKPGKYKEAMETALEGLRIREEAGNKKGVSSSLLSLGELYRKLGDFNKALDCTMRSLRIKEGLNDKKGIARCYNNIGTIYMQQGEYAAAMNYAIKTLKLKEELNDMQGVAGCYNNIAIISMQQNNYEDALSNYFKSLELKKQFAGELDQASCYMNISSLYVHTKDYEQALKYGKIALAIMKKYTQADELAVCYNNLGSIYKHMGRYSEALATFHLVLPMLIAGGNKFLLADLYNNIGEVAGKEGRYKEALEYLGKGKALATEVGAKEWIKDNYFHLSELYAGAGDYKKAYQYQVLYDGVRDSVLNEENMKQVAEMRERYEAEKKERQIIQLNKDKDEQQLRLVQNRLVIERRNLTIAIILSCFAVLLIVGAFAYNSYKIKQKASLHAAIAAQEKMRLNTILETEQKERIRIAKDMHDELGSGISKIIIYNEHSKKFINGNAELNKALYAIDGTVQELVGNMNDLIWSLQIEDSSLEHLLTRIREFATDFLEDSPMEARLDIPFEVTDVVIAKDALRDVFLAFKEAVNNAVKYSRASTVSVQIALAGQRQLTIKITDDGVGMDMDTAERKGNGLRNMRSRIVRNSGVFEIHSQAGSGTEVVFLLDIHQIVSV